MSKSCFVPTCNNTTKNSEKIFITVPFNQEIRNAWCRAVNRDKIPKATSGSFYCCEDHFDLENDCENWIAYKLMQQKLVLKKNVIPHKNLVGEHVSKDFSQLSDSAKKKKVENVKLISQKGVKKLCFQQPSTSKQMPSPQSSPEKSQIMQSSSSSSVGSSLPSTASAFEIENDSSDESVKNINLQTMSLQRTLLVIESHSRFYLGLPKDTYFIVKLLEAESNVCYRNILIVLKKIRLNDSFYRMALDFGITASVISRIFTKDLVIIAAYFKTLIYWPEAHLIKHNLPIPFRARYWNVQSIIDCFEIQIEQPSNALHQSSTWSEYKKCNTIKYLISATPDGIINFVSEGYGGRIMDTQIVKESCYLNVLPQNCDVMADRGFKNIDSMLVSLNCKLIRPPSISSGSKSTKEEVKLSKRIASLRIHIERVIRRLREFEMLKPHACIESNMVWKLDFVVYVACGIINFQGPLIK